MQQLMTHFNRKKIQFVNFFENIMHIMHKVCYDIQLQIDKQCDSAIKQFQKVPTQFIRNACNKMQQNRNEFYNEIVQKLYQLLKKHKKNLVNKNKNIAYENHKLKYESHKLKQTTPQNKPTIRNTEINNSYNITTRQSTHNPSQPIYQPISQPVNINSLNPQNKQKSYNPYIKNSSIQLANSQEIIFPISQSIYHQERLKSSQKMYKQMSSQTVCRQMPSQNVYRQMPPQNAYGELPSQKIYRQISSERLYKQKSPQKLYRQKGKTQKVQVLKKSDVCQSLDIYINKQAKQMLIKSQSRKSINPNSNYQRNMTSNSNHKYNTNSKQSPYKNQYQNVNLYNVNINSFQTMLQHKIGGQSKLEKKLKLIHNVSPIQRLKD